jgi:hypothetical protein
LTLASKLEVILGWLEQAVKDGAFFGACTTLSAVVSHYNDIDLQAVGKGFTNGGSDEELKSLEQVVVLATNALAQLVLLRPCYRIMRRSSS